MLIAGVFIYRSWREKHEQIEQVFGRYSPYVTILQHYAQSDFLQGDARSTFLLQMPKKEYLEFAGSGIGVKYDYPAYDAVIKSDSFQSEYTRKEAVDCRDLKSNLSALHAMILKSDGLYIEQFIDGYVLNIPTSLVSWRSITLIRLESDDENTVRLGFLLKRV
jgi:hypothetical protein